MAVRLRPLNQQEQEAGDFVPWRVRQNTIEITKADQDGQPGKKPQKLSFAFDHCFNETHSNELVYLKVAKSVVASCLEGYNATLFMYGQTGSGKTYTMLGYNQHAGLYNKADAGQGFAPAHPMSPSLLKLDPELTMGIEDFNSKYPDFVYDTEKEDFDSNTGILIQSLKDIFKLIEEVRLADPGH